MVGHPERRIWFGVDDVEIDQIRLACYYERESLGQPDFRANVTDERR